MAPDCENGYIDLQVNGGGGVLFTETPSVETLETMVAAHRAYGTTTIFPTLISSSTVVMRQAIAAVRDYLRSGRPGVGGIHLEGPFLARGKAGVHNQGAFRRMTDEDFDLVTSLAAGRTIITVAPEAVSPQTITRLVDRGVIVSLGHSEATFRQAMAAFDAGARLVTHLFNAMPPLQTREPGLLGAALAHPDVHCGIIADGHHVHDSNLRLAYDIKGPDRLFLVTDAMATVGTDLSGFQLQGREIKVAEGRCLAADGTLAGSALDMRTAVGNCIRRLQIPSEDARRMARPDILNFNRDA